MEFRYVVHYLWLLKTPPKDAFNSMQQAYGENCPSLSFIRTWYKSFNEGRTNIEDLPRSGRPPTQGLVEQILTLLDDYPFYSARMIAKTLNKSKSTIIKVLKEELNMKKRSTRWVPYILSDEVKSERIEVSNKIYKILINSSERKLNAIITCDESWFYYNYYSSSVWLPEGEKVEKPKRLISDEKIMIFTAFSTAGLILIEMLPRGQRFNSTYMCEIILPKLRQKIKEHPEIKSNIRPILHMDNAKPHNSQKTQEKIEELGFSRLPQPRYSPDLSPNDFFLYGYIKEKLENKFHSTPAELMKSIIGICQEIDKITWKNVYESWINRLDAVIGADGEYL